MIFEQFYLDCLSQASYLIADETTDLAVVVDPLETSSNTSNRRRRTALRSSS